MGRGAKRFTERYDGVNTFSEEKNEWAKAFLQKISMAVSRAYINKSVQEEQPFHHRQ